MHGFEQSWHGVEAHVFAVEIETEHFRVGVTELLENEKTLVLPDQLDEVQRHCLVDAFVGELNDAFAVLVFDDENDLGNFLEQIDETDTAVQLHAALVAEMVMVHGNEALEGDIEVLLMTEHVDDVVGEDLRGEFLDVGLF